MCLWEPKGVRTALEIRVDELETYCYDRGQCKKPARRARPYDKLFYHGTFKPEPIRSAFFSLHLIIFLVRKIRSGFIRPPQKIKRNAMVRKTLI